MIRKKCPKLDDAQKQKERELSGEPDRYKLAGGIRAKKAAARKAKAEAEAAAKLPDTPDNDKL